MTTKASVAQTLAAFARQLASAGWVPGARTTSAAIASQAFAYSKGSQHWNAALTVTAVRAGVQAAFLTTTKADGE